MSIGRRRFLTVMAGAGLCATAARSGVGDPVTWRGRALGAEAEIRLYGTDTAKAAQALAAARDTIARMEDLFSLYRRTSALNRLNASGALRMPPEFARLIGHVDRINRRTGGLFDPTVQPLMVAQARADHALKGPERRALAARIGWNRVRLQQGQISFSVPGMAMTLNGIAQGFATDRVSEVLRAHGFEPHLVHVGEFRAGMHHARIGIAGSTGSVLENIDLHDAAIATSAPFGTRFENGTGHIVRPDLKQVEPRWQSVTVRAATAAEADGLSTALALTTTTELAEECVDRGMVQAVWLEHRNGSLIRF